MNSPEPSTNKSTASSTYNSGSPAPSRNKHLMWVIAVIAIILLIIFIQHHRKKADEDHKHNAANLVVLAKVTTGDVPVYIAALGTVTPTYSVTVKTQVNGELLQVLYQEGQTVKAGEILAQIDPRTYQAQLTQFQGQLARDQALLANAKVDLKRYQMLYKLDSVAEQTLATQQSLVKQDEGIVKLDQGQVAAAQVNLAYCKITSPIDGRVGLRLVDPGNFVQTSDTTGLAVINTINPITVVFTIPEDDVPQVIKQVYGGKKLLVKAYDRTQNTLLATGTLLTIDNEIDPTTGTVKLKAQFQNNDFNLFPNQFVNVQLLVNTLHNAVLVPTSAIQEGAQGSYVYLLNNDDTVSAKIIGVGITSGDDTNITSGVSPGQSVVVEGADKLNDGAKVTPYTPNNTARNAGSDKSENGNHHHKKVAA